MTERQPWGFRPRCKLNMHNSLVYSDLSCPMSTNTKINMGTVRVPWCRWVARESAYNWLSCVSFKEWVLFLNSSKSVLLYSSAFNLGNHFFSFSLFCPNMFLIPPTCLPVCLSVCLSVSHYSTTFCLMTQAASVTMMALPLSFFFWLWIPIVSLYLTVYTGVMCQIPLITSWLRFK